MEYLDDSGRFHLPDSLQKHIDGTRLEGLVIKSRNWRDKSEFEFTYLIKPTDLTDAEVEDFAVLVEKRSPSSKRLHKALRAISDYDNAKVPHFEALHSMLIKWLRKNAPTGWLYMDGKTHATPYLITTDRLYFPRVHDRDDKPHVSIGLVAATMTAGGRGGRTADVQTNITLQPGTVTNRTIARIIEAAGWVLETPELKAEHTLQIDHVKATLLGQFTKQFRRGRSDVSPGERVLLLSEDKHMTGLLDAGHESLAVADADGDYPSAVPIPVHPIVSTFELGPQEFGSCNALALTPYRYDKSMADKLILPETHMDMLDVLTTETDAFLGDLVEGKSAGNIILCKGSPGIGKTLTAEVYSELVEMPIYSVHSGSLGTTAHEVEKELRTIFERVTKWNCLLLLDEADVFVRQRGSDLNQNAIVAVFLRMLEYFDGLMFMTTNRSDDIDDAIISRCAAIIDYGLPTPSDARAIWSVLAKVQGHEMSEELLDACVRSFPKATPRDIKHLLRLGLRVAASRSVDLSEDLLREVAMFRAVHIAEKTTPAHAKPVPRTRRRQRAPGAEAAE